MPTNPNYLSLYGAVNKNGQPIDFTNDPLLEDINTESIVWVRLSQAADTTGTLVDAFELMIENKGGLSYSTVYLYTYTGFDSIMNFNGGLIALNTETPFTNYTGLIAIDFLPLINQPGTTNLAQGMLINDRYVIPNGRRYQPSTNSTFLRLKWANKLIATVIEFQGNQTTSGSYSLFYTAS